MKYCLIEYPKGVGNIDHQIYEVSKSKGMVCANDTVLQAIPGHRDWFYANKQHGDSDWELFKFDDKDNSIKVNKKIKEYVFDDSGQAIIDMYEDTGLSQSAISFCLGYLNAKGIKCELYL